MKITSIVRSTQPVKVFDFTVDEAHHYILENGVVSHNSYFPTQAMSGGGGLTYCSDSIAFLSKKKDRDKDKNVVGNLITVKMQKSRLSKENAEVEVRLSYETGLDRYSGLLEMGVEAGMIEKGTVGRYTFPDKQTATENKINETPEKFFTPAFLKELDEKYVRPTFSYGSIITQEESAE